MLLVCLSLFVTSKGTCTLGISKNSQVKVKTLEPLYSMSILDWKPDLLISGMFFEWSVHSRSSEIQKDWKITCPASILPWLAMLGFYLTFQLLERWKHPLNGGGGYSIYEVVLWLLWRPFSPSFATMVRINCSSLLIWNGRGRTELVLGAFFLQGEHSML
jgi:hypothetical protein